MPSGDLTNRESGSVIENSDVGVLNGEVEVGVSLDSATGESTGGIFVHMLILFAQSLQFSLKFSANINVDGNVLSINHGDGTSTNVLSANAGVNSGQNGVMLTANANLAETEVNLGNDFGLEANVGVGVDTGVAVTENSVTAAVGGLGITVGQSMGISTPIGSIKITLPPPKKWLPWNWF